MPSAHRATSQTAEAQPRRMSFDYALQRTAPHLNAAERGFIAAVAGFAPTSTFAPAAWRRIEGAPFGTGEELVTYIGAPWQRHLPLLRGKRDRHSSTRFAMTAAGRALVMRTVRVIEVIA